MTSASKPAVPRSLRAAVTLTVAFAFAPGLAHANHAHQMPVGGSAHGAQWGASQLPSGAPTTHLNYWGGRVVSNAQVVVVLWGAGSYLSNVSSTSSPSMATFYQGILNSPHVDWLAEYNTDFTGGTRQFIGRGSFLTQVTITPSTVATTVDDTVIQSELASQILAGNLPAPTVDARGNSNTYYAIFFPAGITITESGFTSCVAGGFCAYHSTIANVGGREVFYGVHPDMRAPSGCSTGCGGSANPFDNYTSVASHELIETITDPEVGLALILAPPLAWYDPVNAEIGDICNASQSTILGGDGVTYTVQKEWSNSLSACIARPPNDYSLALNPATTSVAVGGTATVTVSTTQTNGTPETVALSVSNLPSGVTGSFSPASVTAGNTATLTLSAASNASLAAATGVVVKAVAPSATHTAFGTVAVTPAPNDFAITLNPPSGIVVAGNSTTFTVTTSVTSGVAQTITLAPTVLAPGFTPSLSPNTITAGGTATLTIFADPSVAAGTVATVTVTGTGTSATHAASASVTVALPPNEFSITLNTGSGSVVAGSSTTFTVATSVTSGSSQAIALSVAGLPAGVTGSFNPASINAGGTSVLTLAASSGAPASSATTFTVTGTGTSATHGANAALTVIAAPNDFAIALTPPSSTVAAGSSTPFTVTTTVTSGFSQVIALSVSGLPSGVTGSFNPGSINAGGTSVLTLTAASGAPTSGATTFTVTGMGTFATHAATAAVSVTTSLASVTVNGGFESGKFNGWKRTGSTTIVKTGVHTGSFAARIGATTPSATSSLVQNFVLPSSVTTHLTFWFNASCSDTGSSGLSATLLDEKTKKTIAMLPRVCSTGRGWQQVDVDVSAFAGHRVKLTFTNVDDHKPGTPTFATIDDVATFSSALTAISRTASR